MALFKILKGQQARLPSISKQGYAYYTTDKGKFYIFNSETQRRTLNPDIKITIGNQTKTSTTLSPEVAFDLASIGAAAAGHNHDDRYLKLSGGTITGDLTVNGNSLLQGETITRILRPQETKKYSLGTNDYKWSALYVSGDAQIDGSIRNLAVDGGIYWNPYVESAGDGSDAASIEVIKAGVAGGTELRIKQMNDANNVVNIVTSASTGFKHNGHTVWDDTNDGSGSGADADLLDGYHGNYQPSANTYVRREGNGYTKQSYILYTPSKSQNPTIGSFVVTNTGDNYFRFATKTNVVNQLAESPGTLINNNGHTYSITVTGDANTYYPVVIDTPLEKEAINYVSIWKNLGSKTATYTGNHSNGTSSMWLIYEVRNWMWDGNGGYLKCWYYSMPYANLCATTSAAGSGSGKLVVYLRGGGTSYNISTTYKSSVSVYYQQTNLGDSSSPVNVSPTTSIGNGGRYSTTVLGYGDLTGNADTSTIPLGFASRSTNPAWGEQTGSTITCWDDSSGGSVEFRRNNPSNGKLSIKVNGRFYGNEGSYPAMLIRWRNNYWGLGNPDGDDFDWIRTTINGLIPFQSGGQGNGHSALGTSSWYFKEAFIDNINGTNLYLRGQTGNRLVWLNGSKMLDTAGHYASGSKIAVNSTEEPGYNFYVNGTSYFVNNVNIAGANTDYKLYVNGNSYFTGTIRAKTAGSSWIDGQKRTDRSALLVTDATDSDSYWPWVSHHNISSKRYFSLGQLANSIYLIGTTDTRTTNGYDYGWQFDFSNGVMTVPGNIQPVSTNTQTLGTSSLRWAKVYIGTADTYGSTTKGVYWNAGVPTAMAYELKSTVNDGTATRIAYYSGTNAVSSGSIVTDGSYLRNIGGYNNSSYSLSAESAIINNYLNIAGISSSPTRYKLYVVGQSWISGTLWNQHLYPEATKTYDLGSTSYIWNNIYGNQLWLYNLQEGNSDITDNTEILTSYASNNGFADSNAVGKVYKRDAIHLYNYIISKTDNFYVKSDMRGQDFNPNRSGYWAGMTTQSGLGGWWHLLSMDWEGDDTTNWVSQLALPTAGRKGLYYRSINSSAISNAGWNKVVDCSGDTMTGNLNFNNRGACYIGNGSYDSADGAGGRLNNLVISSWWGVSFTTSCGGTNYSGTTAVGIDCRYGNISAGGNLWVSQNNATGGGIHLADDGGFYDFNNGWGTAAFSSGLIVARGKDQNNTAISLSTEGRGWASSSSEAQFGVQSDSSGRNFYLYANGANRGIFSGNVGSVILLHNDNIVHMYANTYHNRSDIRLKQNIFNLKQKQSVNFIRQLQPVKFQFKHTDKYCFGFIAQDVLKVMKNFNLKEKDYNLVTKPEFDPNHPENERYYDISYTELIAPTIKAVQYLDKQIEQNKQKENELQQQILRLKSQIQLLNAKLDTLVVSHL